ncbi:MAG: hypothetical protein V4675_12565 [Verrucomicrobiota bacterium]
MLLLPSFTALLLTLPLWEAPAAGTHGALLPYFPLPCLSAGLRDRGIPPVRPFPVADVVVPRNPGRATSGTTRPATPLPPVQPLPRVPMELMEPVPRPTSPLGRRAGAVGSFAADSMAPASFSLGGDLFFVAHPWFGIIFIQSPGFVVEPGQLITLPWNPPGLSCPVTASGPGAILLDEPVFTIGQPGFVSWIINL